MAQDRERRALEARITELEIRYTHQEALIDTLSDLIREQHALIEGLRHRIERLEAGDEEAGDASGLLS
jgi:uncharacterized coiled-coil protein SlyX